ncbi:F-box/LRR-repeat protein [Trifolium medium]|uniref:F-box/LRR-repeat protein n=1 Tax=Trifolium medium TaxID=97028 RepID=A0A392LXJ4_9FABA|nr:F-box/LRR-repeat protein [Trifolium medium]
MDDRISELPDYILSDILTMLSMRDLLKTSILSKRWCKLWYLRRDLYFDVFNVLGSSEEELLQTGYLVDVLNTSYIPPGFKFYGVPTMETHINLDMSRDEFVNRVNQFVMNFQGEIIDSFVVNFYLDDEQSSTVDQWISFAIERGVGRIDLLLLGRPYNKPIGLATRRNPCKIDFGSIFLKSNASTLNHLRLQNCLALHPTNCDFTPFKNLRSLSLEESKLDETFMESLLSNCPRLEELCLTFCEFKSSMPEIVSSSLRHLKVIGCYFVSKYDHQVRVNLVLLDCLKLASLELDRLELTSSEDGFDTLNFNTPMLKSIIFSIPLNQDLNTYVALCATFFPQLEILHLTTYTMVTTSLKITQPIKHLKQLNLFIFVDSDILDDAEYDPLWFLNILQACPLLQKLSIMFTEPEFFENQNDVTRDVETFSHDEIKVIELGGCVGNWFEIEFVMNVLKYAHKLEHIVMSPYWREDDELDWKSNSVWFQSGRKRVSEKLQIEEVIGREKVVLK